MQILMNGSKIEVSKDMTVGQLLRQMGYSRSVAVFQNGSQLLMMHYDDKRLAENDRIRIIRPMGGG